MTTQPKSLTTGQAAAFCSVSLRTVINWINRGLLAAHKLPGRGDHRIQPQDLVQFMRTNDMPVPQALLDGAQSETRVALVVDDDGAMARSISRVLRQAGFEVTAVHNGFEAGMALMRLRPQLMTLDLQMPGLSGFEVLAQMREQGLTETRVIVISGMDAGSRARAGEAGAAAVLAKPFDESELIACAKQLAV
ncbi:response regulator [Exilibacterium tricleocarpae]|uniref:Response regulator n=1 Tax=Exilibacterium tricleocarpae TaxID=2591008 RepID=A0A545TFN0_9GAMM|nr:response regulator [Exilibacterium tricleocarpae]TQV76008.1 response regulator [Exilibacterium tricleocarpae]